MEYLSFPPNESYVPWMPPIKADPEATNAFFFPATRLYRYERTSNGWEVTLWSEQDFAYFSDEYISALAFSPVDPNRAYVATSYGRVFASDDKGVTWTQSQSMVADENWLYGQAIAPSRTYVDVVTIGGSGYGVPAVYRSKDGGVSFTPWSDGLPDTLVYGLAEARDGSGQIFAGTETAVYMRGIEDEQWVDITGNSAPITIYYSVEALYFENTMRFGTYGRGMWDYQIPETSSKNDTGPLGEPGGILVGGGNDTGEKIDGVGHCGCGVGGGPGRPAARWLGVLALVGLVQRRRHHR
jgi:MYXO-CTERM domain-containing protein